MRYEAELRGNCNVRSPTLLVDSLSQTSPCGRFNLRVADVVTMQGKELVESWLRGCGPEKSHYREPLLKQKGFALGRKREKYSTVWCSRNSNKGNVDGPCSRHALMKRV
uniref:Uncharacterized protein n=1 Tax=Vespula pensylvanica TaxID=30213 RepID=A0A834NQ22_VESPE|nr:hypothetical protein H0235_011997 [Vespula pensylvanica]